MTLRRIVFVMSVVAALPPTALNAQAVRTGFLSDTITVGDVVRAAIRVTVPPGTTVTFPDSLTLPPEVENAGDRVITVDTTAASLEITAVYSIAGWRPGAHALPAIEYTVNGAAQTAAFDSLRISSVLPADTTGIKPKPLKAPIGGSRVWWPWVALVAALALAALLYWLWRRRRGSAVAHPAAPARPARELALERLDRAREAGLVEAGDVRSFYSELSGAVRDYLAAIDPMLTQDLTTSELAAAVRRRGANANGIELLTILGAADLVKFARRGPRSGEAYEEWTRARAWVAEAVWPPYESVAAERAA